MKKRLLSGLLVLCLIFSLLPVSAFADEATASGTCGDDLTWTQVPLAEIGRAHV